MYTLRKLTISLLLLLFFISIYKDLTTGTFVETNEIERSTNTDMIKDQHDYNSDFKIETISVKHGETVLSIVEELNGDRINAININNILKDFQSLNPKSDPHFLKINTEYRFPLYNE